MLKVKSQSRNKSKKVGSGSGEFFRGSDPDSTLSLRSDPDGFDPDS